MKAANWSVFIWIGDEEPKLEGLFIDKETAREYALNYIKEREFEIVREEEGYYEGNNIYFELRPRFEELKKWIFVLEINHH